MCKKKERNLENRFKNGFRSCVCVTLAIIAAVKVYLRSARSSGSIHTFLFHMWDECSWFPEYGKEKWILFLFVHGNMNKSWRNECPNVWVDKPLFKNRLNQDFGPWCQSLAVFGVFMFNSCVNTACYLVLCSVKAVNRSLHLCIWKVSLLEYFFLYCFLKIIIIIFLVVFSVFSKK